MSESSAEVPLSSISLWSRLKQTRGAMLFLLLVLASPALLLEGTAQIQRLLSSADLGMTTWLAVHSRVYLSSVHPRWSKVKVGDELIELNGEPTPNVEHYWKARLNLKPGPVTAVLMRGDEKIVDTAELPPLPAWVRVPMAVRMWAGTLMLLLGIASFVMRPGTRVSWLFFLFSYLVAMMMLIFAGEAARPYRWDYTWSMPLLANISTVGLYLFVNFPRRLFSDRVRRRGWLLGAASVALSTAYVIFEGQGLLGVVFEIGCRALSVIGSVATLFIFTYGEKTLNVFDANSQRLKALYRLLRWSAGIGLGLPVAGTLLVRAVGAPEQFFELFTTPVLFFAATVAWSLVRHNALEADRYTSSIIGYTLTLAFLATLVAVVLMTLPWLFTLFPVSRSSEIRLFVAIAAGLSASQVYRVVKRRVDRVFHGVQSDVLERNEALRVLAQRTELLQQHEALETIAHAGSTIGADRVELWLHAPPEPVIQRRLSIPWSAEAATTRTNISRNGGLAIALMQGPGGVAALAPTALSVAGQTELWSLGLALAAPIQMHGAFIGFLGFARKASGFSYSEEDLVFAQHLAMQTAAVLERRPDEERRVGNYRIEKRLNVGGTAEVFAAWKLGAEGFEKRVAIKRLLPELAENERASAMLLDEARIASRLKHPNIAEIFEVGLDPKAAFIAMELLTGQTLRQLIASSRAARWQVPLPVFSAVAKSMLGALEYAHGLTGDDGTPLGIVHRDATPANVMVTLDGLVKLFDFGIATAHTERVFRTQTGMVRGTVPFMSPEQATQGTVDRRSDVFSAAATLYEVLTLERAYPEGPTPELPKAPSALRTELTPAIDEVFAKAMAFDPGQRIESAEAFWQALSKVVAEPATSAELSQWMAELKERTL